MAIVSEHHPKAKGDFRIIYVIDSVSVKILLMCWLKKKKDEYRLMFLELLPTGEKRKNENHVILGLIKMLIRISTVLFVP